jgi:Inner membrane protein YgaP-like, transmembrane domain
MKPLLSRNIDNKGRLVRGLVALALLVGAGFGFALSVWLGIVLLASGVFVAFEALRGWCALRACGIKTRL